MRTIVIIGGGAAGIFSAIHAKQANPALRVLILEKSAVLLAKVRISGGGRCNVTHSCFDPKQLILHYPRGNKELLGPFTRFHPRDTIAWFQSRGVTLKTEKDGRIFPTTDSSETIIQCLLGEAAKLGVEIQLRKRITSIEKTAEGFQVEFKEENPLLCQALILATGSQPSGHEWAKSLGHTIQDPVPSLFTFNIPNSPLREFSGISVEVELHLEKIPYRQRGPLLITHFGFSGPAAIKLSAWAARPLHEKNYRFPLYVNWIPKYTLHEIETLLFQGKSKSPQENLSSLNPFGLPKNLWKYLCQNLSGKKQHDLSKKSLYQLSQKLHRDCYLIDGKTTHKEEFVTCGGVSLSEVNFQTMESKVCKGLFFAGEILDIDGVTGGFNFQSAWTTGYLAGTSSALSLYKSSTQIIGKREI